MCPKPSLKMAHGDSVATSKFIHAIASDFPDPKTHYKVDSSIQGRENRDYLPINANLDSSQVNDGYIEFHLGAQDKFFYNFSKCFLELQVQITKSDNSPVTATDHVAVCDGFAHALISQVQFYLNDVSVETNSYFGLWNVVKTFLTTGYDFHKTFGELNLYRRLTSQNEDVIDQDYFEGIPVSNYMRSIFSRCRENIHMMVPIELDFASARKYLLDNVSARIRFDLNPASVVLLSDNAEFNYKISLAKLHVEKIQPAPSSLISLNKAMRINNEIMEYVIDRTVIKTSIFPSGYSSFNIDNLFSNVVPSRVIVFIVSQAALSGDFKRNPVYLQNCNISNLRLEVDGHVHSSMSGDFENKYAQYLVNTLSNLGSDTNMFTLNNFKNGKTIFVFNLQNSEQPDCLNIEKRGNLRLSLSLSAPLTENHVLFTVGITHGTININADRVVKTSFLL